MREPSVIFLMKMKKLQNRSHLNKYFSIIAFLGCSSAIFAQNETLNYATYVKGIVGQGSGKVKGIEQNIMWGAAVGVSKDMSHSSQNWVNALNVKAINLGLIYNNFEGMKAGYSFGESIGAQAQLEIGVVERENFKFRVVPGFGLGYMSKTTFTDPETRIFGTHINGLFTADLKASYQMTKSWAATAELGFTHYSNGSFKIPNAGINTLNTALGLKYTIPKVDTIDEKVTENIYNPIQKYGVDLVIGAGQRGKYQEHKGFFRMGFYGGYSRFFNQVLGLRVGLDATYYDQVYNPLVYDDTVPYWGRSYDHWRLGASLGGEVKMQKFALTANMGHYLHMKSPVGQKWYWNTSLKFYVTPKFGIQAMLNAHKFQADYINWGVFARL